MEEKGCDLVTEFCLELLNNEEFYTPVAGCMKQALSAMINKSGTVELDEHVLLRYFLVEVNKLVRPHGNDKQTINRLDRRQGDTTGRDR